MDDDVERTLRPEPGPGGKLLWSGRPHAAPFSAISPHAWMASSG